VHSLPPALDTQVTGDVSSHRSASVMGTGMNLERSVYMPKCMLGIRTGSTGDANLHVAKVVDDFCIFARKLLVEGCCEVWPIMGFVTGHICSPEKRGEIGRLLSDKNNRQGHP